MKNIIFLVLDSLSKEYIDSYKITDGGFAYLDKHSICANNMYATAPFTESAVQGMWYQSSPLEIFGGNRIEPASAKSIFSIFQKSGYEIYFSNWGSIGNYALDFKEFSKIRSEKKIKNQVERRTNDLKHYISKNSLSSVSKRSIVNILDILWKEIGYLCKNIVVEEEAENYYGNRDYYIEKLFKEKDTHRLFNICKKLLDQDEKREIREETTTLAEEELLLAANITYRNRELFKKYNKNIGNSDTLIKKHLSGEIYNRDLQTNSSILELMRMDLAGDKDSNMHRGTILSGVQEFVEETVDKIKRPYFAYLHEFSFHYPETFLNACKNKNKKKYITEIKKVLEKIPDLQTGKMSMSRALSLLYINDWLKESIEYLEEKNIFDDTYLVITADHGISNFMYPVDREYRWMFYKENFHVPFWIIGKDIKNKKYDTLCSSKCIVPTLAELCGIKGVDYSKSLFHINEEYVLTEWMNGIPDIEREYIKFGYRNHIISLTFCIRLNQLFNSGRILTLFNLQSDPDELYNLKLSDINETVKLELQAAMLIIYKRWNELRKKYLDSKYSKALDCMESEIEINWLKDQDDNVVFNNVTLYGTDEIATKFLCNYRCECQAVLDALSHELYFMGRKIQNNIDKIDMRDSTCIIACRDEIDALYHLWKWGIKSVYVYTGK